MTPLTTPNFDSNDSYDSNGDFDSDFDFVDSEKLNTYLPRNVKLVADNRKKINVNV